MKAGCEGHMNEYRVYSLTKRFDNFSMWAKYSDEHTGYCLEFANEGPLFENACEVYYRKYPPFRIADSVGRTSLFLVYKRPDWSNEEEVRLILPAGKGMTTHIESNWFTRIILGTKISAENEAQIRAWAKQRVPELTVVRAYLDEFDQELCLR